MRQNKVNNSRSGLVAPSVILFFSLCCIIIILYGIYGVTAAAAALLPIRRTEHRRGHTGTRLHEKNINSRPRLTFYSTAHAFVTTVVLIISTVNNKT